MCYVPMATMPFKWTKLIAFFRQKPSNTSIMKYFEFCGWDLKVCMNRMKHFRSQVCMGPDA
jgi:hypothetical protein